MFVCFRFSVRPIAISSGQLRAADENPFLVVSSHPQALVIGLWPSRPVRVGLTGARFIFFFEQETRVRPLRGAASHEVSCSLQRLQVALRAVTRGGQPRTCPTSTFDRPLFSLNHARVTPRPSPEVSHVQPIGRRGVAADRSRPCGFRTCVLRLACWAVCGTRRSDHHGSRRSDRVMRRGLSSARRSATRASSNPITTGPHIRIAFVARIVRQRSWDFRTLRSVPRLRVPAFVM